MLSPVCPEAVVTTQLPCGCIAYQADGVQVDFDPCDGCREVAGLAPRPVSSTPSVTGSEETPF